MNAESEPNALQEALGALLHLHWLDLVGLGLCVVFVVLGTVRGLWWQVIRLVGLVAAVALARLLAPRWGSTFQETSGLEPHVSQGLVWIGVFIVGLLLASLLGILGKRSIEAMKLGLVDRFGGAVAGLVTGLLLHAAILMGFCYLGPQPWTAESLAGTWSEGLARSVSTNLPVLLDEASLDRLGIRRWLAGEGAPDGSPPPVGAQDDPGGG
ncbi:MAG: CvpA family protein [Planctomycetota bacterium]|jgi:uncharacterized membrane protein required for colicin V production|nr:CvpA family protein [Planctomycetota bacterium]MDP6763396.1 CvpA family protein [Planctomycetota bacterium]MDP6989761.1 CvpA family protein [Planctomycetota bacterium]